MSKSMVSVIIPAYNHENYIQQTIQSIINQTYQNIELIIIDDGSKDSTFEKMKELEEVCQKRFKNVYFEKKQNEGTCTTINKLLSIAQGEYVYLMASDDCAKENAIEKELEFLQNNPEYSLCVGNNEFIDKNSKVCYWDRDRNITYDQDAVYKTFKDFLQVCSKVDFNSCEFGTYHTLYTGNYIPNGYLIRRSIFEKTGYFKKQAPLEDWYLMLQISKYAKMKYLDEILFSYRIHSNNTIQNKEYMEDVSNRTIAYENEVALLSADFSIVKDDVKNVYKNGILIKKRGIPCVFEVLKYRKYKSIVKKIKLFNITICKYKKG